MPNVFSYRLAKVCSSNMMVVFLHNSVEFYLILSRNVVVSNEELYSVVKTTVYFCYN